MNPLLPLVLLGTLLAVNSGKWKLLASPVIFFSSPFFKRGTDKHGAADMFKQLCCSVKCQRDTFPPVFHSFLFVSPTFFFPLSHIWPSQLNVSCSLSVLGNTCHRGL